MVLHYATALDVVLIRFALPLRVIIHDLLMLCSSVRSGAV